MKMLVRLLLVALGLGLVVLAIFVLLGPSLEEALSPKACRDWFEASRSWAWLLAIGLLIGDLLLPIPATGVMAALGAVYGPLLGGVIGTTGSILAGCTGYGIARLAGQKLADLLANREEQAECQALFDRWGGLGIILSRLMPILPEVFTVLAGLAHMRLKPFLLALFIGSTAVGFLFAWLGAVAMEAPAYGLPLVLGIPALLWLGIALLRRKK